MTLFLFCRQVSQRKTDQQKQPQKRAAKARSNWTYLDNEGNDVGQNPANKNNLQAVQCQGNDACFCHDILQI